MRFYNCFNLRAFAASVYAMAILNQAFGASVSTAPPPVTTGLFVQLNGNNLATSGAASTWTDQANDGNALGGTYQNFVQATSAKQPVVVLDNAMPNGLTANVMNYARGAQSNLNRNSTSGSDLFVSVAGGLDGTTTSGADPAYNVNALTYFTVFQSTLNPLTNSTQHAQERSVIITGDYSASTGVFITATHEQGNDADGNLFPADQTNEIPDLYVGTRGSDTVQVGHGIQDMVVNRWYITATSWDTVSGTSRIEILDQLGNVLDKSFTTSPIWESGLTGHANTWLGGISASSTVGNAFDGSIAEVLMYNAALGTSDFDSVISYLNNKYFVAKPGDYDRNGVVDEADYGAWRIAFDTAASPAGSGADGNGDGLVNAADYVLWRKYLPASSSGAGLGVSASVPEPASIFMAALCVMLLGRRRIHRSL